MIQIPRIKIIKIRQKSIAASMKMLLTLLSIVLISILVEGTFAAPTTIALVNKVEVTKTQTSETEYWTINFIP